MNHQGQFPVVTISFNLAPGSFAGRGGDGDREGGAGDWDCRRAFTASFQGTAQAFQDSLANEPLLILAALVTVYIVLGVLYESLHSSDHDSFDAAVGGRGRAAGAACLP